MKWLADENVDRQIIDLLRDEGHDVESIAETRRGADDEAVIAVSSAHDAILITSDKDFGELVFRLKRVAAGVILLRLDGMKAADRARRVSAVIRAHGADLAQAFTVVTHAGIRVRSL